MDARGPVISSAVRPAASHRCRRPHVRFPKRWVFLGITLLTPLLLFAVAEGIARLAWPEGALPMFVEAPVGNGRYLVANRAVGRRWFARERVPPAPMLEPFAAQKPSRGFRVFVLGESSTAGFPYPRNGTFSRVLRDMLRDVLPDDSVEVVNLGIAATNTYALADIAREVLAQSPDAVLIYAGHNEYYGALGAASTENVLGSSPALTRVYLWMLRSRLVLALREALQRGRSGGAPDAQAATLMETLAGTREIPLGGEIYRRGVRQFETNLTRVVRVFRDEGVPVFVGSLASNLRDQPPLAARANRGPAAAEGAYLEARHALRTENLTLAQTLYARARDLDVVRFRAPTEFNLVVERVTKRTGAAYVPIAEAAARDAPGGVPGAEFFLEHVHPNRRGYVRIASVFFESLRDAGFVGRPAQLDRLRTPDDYFARMELTPFDERIVRHTLQTLTTRWPFVAATRRSDYRRTYRPSDMLDSLAFGVSGGAPWEVAKLRVASEHERLGHHDLAVAEYRGLVRDAPLFEEPLRLLGRALLANGEEEEGERVLERALALKPTPYAANTLAALALRRRALPRGIALLTQSLALHPNQPEALHQLSLAYGLAGDLENARRTAVRLRQLAPGFPGLAQWLQSLGVTR